MGKYLYLCMIIYIYAHGQDGGAAQGTAFWLHRANVLCNSGCRRIGRTDDEICPQHHDHHDHDHDHDHHHHHPHLILTLTLILILILAAAAAVVVGVGVVSPASASASSWWWWWCWWSSSSSSSSSSSTTITEATPSWASYWKTHKICGGGDSIPS